MKPRAIPEAGVRADVADGLSDAEIAKKRGVGKDTVRRLRGRLGLKAVGKPGMKPGTIQHIERPAAPVIAAEDPWEARLAGRRFEDRPGLKPGVFRSLPRRTPMFSVGCAAAMCVER